MKKYFFIILIFILPLFALSQKNYLISIDQLNARVNSNSDTIYVINFWATWCAPCIKELPCFTILQERFKMEKLKVLLVSVDFKSELNTSVIPFLKRKNITGEVWLIDEKDQQQFIEGVDKSWSGAIPATLFIRGSKRKFFEKEFECEELTQQYKNLFL